MVCMGTTELCWLLQLPCIQADKMRAAWGTAALCMASPCLLTEIPSGLRTACCRAERSATGYSSFTRSVLDEDMHDVQESLQAEYKELHEHYQVNNHAPPYSVQLHLHSTLYMMTVFCMLYLELSTN